MSHLWQQVQAPGWTGHQVIVKGDGIWLENAKGERFMDMVSIAAVGHGRKEMGEAIRRQMDQLSFVMAPEAVAPVSLQLAEALARLSPDPGTQVFFSSGGSEAIDTAVKMARQYFELRGEPRRHKLIARRRHLHGSTLGAAWLTGGGMAQGFGPLPPNPVISAPGPLRCQRCGPRGPCDLWCARELEAAIQAEGPETVAGFVAEPIAYGADCVVPEAGYWAAIREICDRHGILFICDEVFTGVGRSGRFFAIEHWAVKPDILVLAKALSSGYVPLGATLASTRVADAFRGKDFRHGFTFGGHPLAAAAGLENLAIIQREGLLEASERLGAQLFRSLQKLREYSIVAEVRGGKGLLCALELADPRTGARFPSAAGLADRLRAATWKHGLIGYCSDVVRVLPPLTITEEELHELVQRLARVVNELQAALVPTW